MSSFLFSEDGISSHTPSISFGSWAPSVLLTTAILFHIIKQIDHCRTALLSWWWHDAGEIPASLGQLTSLKTLNLYDNQLSGTIRATVCLLLVVVLWYLWDDYSQNRTTLSFIFVDSMLMLYCGWVTALLYCRDGDMMQAKFPRVWVSSITSKLWIFPAICCQVKCAVCLLLLVVVSCVCFGLYEAIIFKTKLLVVHIWSFNDEATLWMYHCGGCTASLWCSSCLLI